MDVWFGYSGIAIAFVILAALLIWITIHLPGRLWIKGALVPLVLWYGVALYYLAPNLMGWPADQQMPEESRLLAVRVKEPDPAQDKPGAIYLWVSDAAAADARGRPAVLDPRTFFNYDGAEAPRAYRIPYSREMHQKIIEAQMQARSVPGAMMTIRRRGKDADGDRAGRSGSPGRDTPMSLEIIHPKELMPKPRD